LFHSTERILQIGKSKLVLDHLIVEKMDEENLGAKDVESILRFGAEALFHDQEDESSLKYGSEDIEKLLDRSQIEKEKKSAEETKNLNGLAFARIWDHDKKILVDDKDAEGGEPAETMEDVWAKLLEERLAQIAEQESAPKGRGARKRTKVVRKITITIKRESFIADFDYSQGELL
jgi:hypothetical protein